MADTHETTDTTAITSTSTTPEQPASDGQTVNGSGNSKKAKFILTLVVLAVVVAGGYIANRYWIKPVAAHGTSSGKYPMAPAFSLTDIFGHSLSLDQYRGKVVLLDFWATWCGPCRSEIPGFIQLQKTYADQGFQIIGISEDQGGAAPVLDFYKQESLDYRVALDNGKVSELYGGIIGLPTTFLIGRDGRIYEKLPGAVGADFFEPAIKTLLATSPATEAKNFQAMDGSETPQVETPAEVNSPVSGVDVGKLTQAQLAQYEAVLSKQQCSCGCNMSVLECRKTDPGCATSRQQAQATLQKIEQSKHKI
jgi:thiol-disulfide isomerase/thioredoxin